MGPTVSVIRAEARGPTGKPVAGRERLGRGEGVVRVAQLEKDKGPLPRVTKPRQGSPAWEQGKWHPGQTAILGVKFPQEETWATHGQHPFQATLGTPTAHTTSVFGFDFQCRTQLTLNTWME